VNLYQLLPKIPFGKFYVAGNYVDGSPETSQDNWLGVTMEKGTAADAQQAKLAYPFAVVDLPMYSADAAYEAVLQQAGAVLPMRDTLDQRIINDVKNREGRLIDVQGGYPHGTAYEISKNAWPSLESMPAAPDTDQDGMPDAWEKEQGLNPSDKNDAALFTIDKRYTNIELYINGLVQPETIKRGRR